MKLLLGWRNIGVGCLGNNPDVRATGCTSSQHVPHISPFQENYLLSNIQKVKILEDYTFFFIIERFGLLLLLINF